MKIIDIEEMTKEFKKWMDSTTADEVARVVAIAVIRGEEGREKAETIDLDPVTRTVAFNLGLVIRSILAEAIKTLVSRG